MIQFLITIAVICMALIILKKFWLPPPKYLTIEESEGQGLLLTEEYQATRAFQLDEWEDEGSHYFVELRDGSVLYLNG